jgi:hypothetical protein
LKQCAVYQDTRAVAPAIERRKRAELPPWLLSTIVADRTGLECAAGNASNFKRSPPRGETHYQNLRVTFGGNESLGAETCGHD